MKIHMFTSEIDDQMIRRSMQALEYGLDNEELLKYNFQKIEFTTDKAVTNLLIPHSLGSTPTDVLVTRITGGSITWNYDDFTDKLLSVTTTGPVKVRALIGTYRENTE